MTEQTRLLWKTREGVPKLKVSYLDDWIHGLLVSKGLDFISDETLACPHIFAY